MAGLLDFDVSDEWPDGDDDLMALSGVDCVWIGLQYKIFKQVTLVWKIFFVSSLVIFSFRIKRKIIFLGKILPCLWEINS